MIVEFELKLNRIENELKLKLNKESERKQGNRQKALFEIQKSG